MPFKEEVYVRIAASWASCGASPLPLQGPGSRAGSKAQTPEATGPFQVPFICKEYVRIGPGLGLFRFLLNVRST